MSLRFVVTCCLWCESPDSQSAPSPATFRPARGPAADGASAPLAFVKVQLFHKQKTRTQTARPANLLGLLFFRLLFLPG